MDQIRWNAIKNNDSTFDGKFYYGVQTTGIFCVPSCKSKLPRPENVIYFNSYEQAMNRGFRPCKRCRPDLFVTYAPNEPLLIKIKEYIEQTYLSPHCLEGLAERFSISRFHLIRIYKTRFGITPHEYVQNLRIESGKFLLSSTNIRIIDIAFQCGFQSYSAFYNNFKRITQMTPEEYRKGEGQ